MTDKDSTTPQGDEFELYDLRVEVVESEKPFVMHVKKGDYFDVIGGRVVFPEGNPSFSLSTDCSRCCPSSLPSSDRRIPTTG